MRRQTTWLKLSAKAAKLSANAAMTGSKAALVSAKAAIGVAVPILVLQELQFENHGGSYKGLFQYPVSINGERFLESPAFLKSYAITLSTDNLPDEPIYPRKPWPCDMHEVVDAGEPYTLGEGRASTNEWPDEATLAALEAKEKNPVVYGFITYGDVFGSPLHTLKFSKIFFELDPDGGNALTMDWGGPKYTGQSGEENPN